MERIKYLDLDARLGLVDPQEAAEKHEAAVKIQEERKAEEKAEWQVREERRLAEQEALAVAPASTYEMDRVRENISWAITYLGRHAGQNLLRESLISALKIAEDELRFLRHGKRKL